MNVGQALSPTAARAASSPAAPSPQPSPSAGADFPSKLRFLFKPARYKVLYGGRGGAKSWGIARALLLLGMQKPLRVLCTREFQNSILDSVHQILCDQIYRLDIAHFYDIQQQTIKGRNGTSFGFEGIRQNVRKLKSYEGADICWVEEAANVTKNSWDVLIPTIRKEGSEIWISFNPELETDETYKRFVKNPPANAVVTELNWRDNPWFPEVLRREKDDLKARDPDAYLNVWEGKCRILLEGAVYAEEIRTAIADGRICKVPYDPTSGVEVFFDLGWADNTALWLRQRVGFELHYIEYYENRQKLLAHYLDWLQKKPYIYSTFWLPHDARAKELGTGTSIEEQVRKAGRQVRIVRNLSVGDGINAARTIFQNCWFDESLCQQGLNALRGYHYEVVTLGQTLARNPVHDWASHGADAFRYSAVASKQPKSERAEGAAARRHLWRPRLDPNATAQSWMA